jgi:citrate lyase subunit beta / citryl-CoA lyase
MNLDEVTAWLYAPASRPELFAKARAAADGVVVDLEDAVLPSERAGARANLSRVEHSPETPVVVRVNPVGSDDFLLDVEAVTPLVRAGAVEAVRVTKVTTLADVDAAAEAVADWPVERPLICQLESARGVREAFAIAEHPAVAGIMLGEADLRADLGLPRGAAGIPGLTLARQTVVLASRAAGLPAPVASAFTQLDDAEGLRADTAALRDLGFHGRSCLHPRQVGVVREVFAPTADDVAWATAVVAAAEDAGRRGRGATTLDDGSFVDPAVERRARRILRGTSRLA